MQEMECEYPMGEKTYRIDELINPKTLGSQRIRCGKSVTIQTVTQLPSVHKNQILLPHDNHISLFQKLEELDHFPGTGKVQFVGDNQFVNLYE